LLLLLLITSLLLVAGSDSDESKEMVKYELTKGDAGYSVDYDILVSNINNYINKMDESYNTFDTELAVELDDDFLYTDIQSSGGYFDKAIELSHEQIENSDVEDKSLQYEFINYLEKIYKVYLNEDEIDY